MARIGGGAGDRQVADRLVIDLDGMRRVIKIRENGVPGRSSNGIADDSQSGFHLHVPGRKYVALRLP
jgi:hypothetical protein